MLFLFQPQACRGETASSVYEIHVGPILDDRLKEKNPETLWPMNLIFGLNDPWDMRKKRKFLFFEMLRFLLAIFEFFPFI